MGHFLIGTAFVILIVCGFFIASVLKMIDEEDDIE